MKICWNEALCRSECTNKLTDWYKFECWLCRIFNIWIWLEIIRLFKKVYLLMNIMRCKTISNCKILMLQVDSIFTEQSVLSMKIEWKVLRKRVLHLFLPYKSNSSSNIIKQKQSVNNYSIEAHFTISHSASFSSHVSITMKKNKLFKEEKFKVENRYQ